MTSFAFRNAIKANLVAIGVSLAGMTMIVPQMGYADVGSYLATRQAVFDQSFPEQAKYALKSLVAEPQNVEFLETYISSKMSMGQFSDVYGYAKILKEQDISSQIAAMVLLPQTVKDADWDAVTALVDEDEAVSPLVDELTKAWALVGAGDMDAALAQFEAAASTIEGFGVYCRYNRAVALGLAGDYEGGLSILDDPSMMVSEDAAFARIQMLSQLERNDDALELLTDLFGETRAPYVTALRASLEQGETLDFDVVTSVQDGVAGVFQSVAELVDGNLSDNYTLLYAQIALELRPDRADYAITVANLLERMDHAQLATETLEMVSSDSPAYYQSALTRARALRASGQVGEQIEVLEELATTYSDMPEVRVALGDAHRRQENYLAAIKNYTDALDLMPDNSNGQWPILYARGTTYERSDQWKLAEADFRKALEISPGHPDILNYMGYAFLEMNINLDEAMDMIRAAVEAKPDDGYITDSLAWGLFQLGEYEAAVEPMERAVELMPVDPIVNDHLGDVYWSVGRKREAQFQWSRALSFEPEEEEAARIRLKLDVGLDQVLMEEGMTPTRVSLEK